MYSKLLGAAIALALASPAAALAVPAELTVTNLTQPGLESEVPQPPVSVAARGSCATPFSAQEANSGISPCAPGSWPTVGQYGYWGPTVSVAGGDRLQLALDAPVDQVRFSSTTNYPRGLRDPTGAPYPNVDIVSAREADPTSDASVWTLELPLDLDRAQGPGATFSVVARTGTEWRNFAVMIRTPRFNNHQTRCGYFYSPTSFHLTSCIFNYPPKGRTPQPVAAFAGCPVSTANVIRGSTGGASMAGTARGDRIFGGTGNDVVDALAGNDCVDTGTGDDRGQGGLGDDLLLAGIGNDQMSGSSGSDRLRGNPGNDRLDGGRDSDSLFGDAGDDTLLGGFGNDRLHGVSGKDVITGSRGRDRINGGAGSDRIAGGSSGDRIAGDAGSDRINGNSGSDSIKGNSGSDRITSRDNSRDRVNCGLGRDSVVADRKDVVSRNCERVRRS